MKSKFTFTVIFIFTLLVSFSFNQAKATPLTAAITASGNLSCFGGMNGYATVTASGGTSPYTYSWAPSGGNAATASGLSAGSYTVTVTDAASNTATASVTITSPTILTVNAFTVMNVLCNGGNSGCVEAIAAGGTPPYTFAWTPSGGTTDTLCGLSAGTYTVTVADNNGCIGTSATTITQPSVLVSTSTSTNNSSCISPNGSASVTSVGGTPPYTYLWAPSGETTATATGLGAATYTCTVTDNNGCTFTTTASVLGDTLANVSITSTADTVILGDSAILSVNCNTSATYLWAPGGMTTQNITVYPVVTTTYTCVATTACGTFTLTVTVVVVPAPCSNNYDEPICVVTIDTATNQCEVIWGRTNSPPATGSYNVYRDTASAFMLIHNQALNALSEYLDVTSNPSLGPVSYKLSTVDSCGESALSPVHTTIFLTTTSSPNAYNLSWTPYVGFTPLQYLIYRGPSLSSLTKLDSVPNTVFTYTDSFPPLGSFYMLVAENPGVCIPTTKIRPRSASVLNFNGSCSNGFNTAILGIPKNEISSANVNIYPNPANNILNIAITGVSSQADFYLTDMLGRQVSATSYKLLTNGSVETINIESLQPSVYFLTIESNGQKLMKKVTKL